MGGLAGAVPGTSAWPSATSLCGGCYSLGRVDEPDQNAQAASRLCSFRPRGLRRVTALAVGTLISIVVVEGGFRAVMAIRGTAYDGEMSTQRVSDFVARLEGLDFVPQDSAQEPSDSSILLHPYEGFQTPRMWKRLDSSEAYFNSPAGRKNFDIFLIGGSVAAGFGNWTAKTLAPLLETDPRLAGRTVIVHNRACPGHKQPQLATNLEWAFSLGLEPDAVLLIDGFNELAVAANNAEYGVHPLFPAWLQMQTALTSPLNDPAQLEVVADIFALRRSAERLAELAKRWNLTHSAVLGSLVEREFESMSARSSTLLEQFEKLAAEHAAERPLFIRGPLFDKDPANVVRLSLRAWMEGSRSMQASCRARKIQFIHVLQPAARDTGSKPLTESEERLSLEPALWKTVIENGYPLLREAGAKLALEGINFHDASRVFADHPEEIYLDTCHFEGVGSTILAAFVARAMLESWPKE